MSSTHSKDKADWVCRTNFVSLNRSRMFEKHVSVTQWLSGRASERGMRRSEVRFLIRIKNFSLSHARDKTKNHLSLCFDLSHISITFSLEKISAQLQIWLFWSRIGLRKSRYMNNARWLVINLCLSHHYKSNSHK